MSTDRAISLAALTVLEVSPIEAIAIAAGCGYSHVGLRPIAATPNEPHFSLLKDAALRRTTITALKDHGVGVLDIEILRLRPETAVAEFEAVLAFGGEVGAGYALVAGNDPDHLRTADNLAALCELASPYGIRAHLEFMPWTDVPNLATALRVVDSSGSGVLIDAFHLNRSGGASSDVPVGNSRFGYIQLCDIAGPIPADMDEILREARRDRRYPGEGDCDLVALLRRLPSNMPVSIEVPGKMPGLTARAHAQYALDCTFRVLDCAISRDSAPRALGAVT